MKNFQELTKEELVNLTEQQVDAYVDIELAREGIVKQIEVRVDYPDFVKKFDTLPEKDMTVYEVDGYAFADIETAQNFSTYVGTLPQLRINYDYYTGDSVYYVEGQKFETPPVTLKKMYSQAKYEACKTQIKQIKEQLKKENEKQDNIVEEVINYDEIDRVKDNIKREIRQAIVFFEKVKSISDNYTKYLSITSDKEIALKTLWTVFNIEDEEIKEKVIEEIEKVKEEVTN